MKSETNLHWLLSCDLSILPTLTIDDGRGVCAGCVQEASSSSHSPFSSWLCTGVVVVGVILHDWLLNFEPCLQSLTCSSPPGCLLNGWFGNFTDATLLCCDRIFFETFKLPSPTLCICGIVKIELSGRMQKQFTDDRYYIWWVLNLWCQCWLVTFFCSWTHRTGARLFLCIDR
jgi:hypothetical protein